MSRVYVHLTMKKRAGHFNSLVVPNRNPEDLTVPCVTCPSPGLNLPDDWKDAPADMR